MSDNTAILNGYTREIIADSGMDYMLHLFVKPDADLDGSFKAYDADECEWVRVSGWNFTIEDVALHSDATYQIIKRHNEAA